VSQKKLVTAQQSLQAVSQNKRVTAQQTLQAVPQQTLRRVFSNIIASCLLAFQLNT
jgi:hypothetical protein